MKTIKRIIATLLSLILLVGTCTVAMPPEPVQAAQETSIAMNYKELTLPKGTSFQLKLKGTAKTPKWSSSKKSVVTVSSKGKLKTLKNGTAKITAKLGGKAYTCKVVVKKYQEALTGDVKTDQVMYRIIKEQITASMTDVEKVKAIHDYIVLNCAYDHSNYLKDTVPKVSYTATGVLVKKTAVCQGYAETFQAFMDALGIPCKIVTNPGVHAWNMVKVNGNWFHIDVTWDDPVPDQKGQVRYDYFLVPDSVFKGETKHKWDKSAYPKCSTSCDQFIDMLGTVYESKSQIQGLLENGVVNGIADYMVIVPSNRVSERDVADCVFGVTIESFNCSSTIYGNYTIYQIHLKDVGSLPETICTDTAQLMELFRSGQTEYEFAVPRDKMSDETVTECAFAAFPVKEFTAQTKKYGAYIIYHITI